MEKNRDPGEAVMEAIHKFASTTPGMFITITLWLYLLANIAIELADFWFPAK